jgi:hypothetical protein
MAVKLLEAFVEVLADWKYAPVYFDVVSILGLTPPIR